MTFYDSIAANYDALTGAARRQAAVDRFVAETTKRYAIGSALDAACGTGLYTLALARAGVRTVGSDISASMLAEAKRQADEAGLDIDWICAPMQDLAEKTAGPFDAVLCVGNSLPHLTNDGDLARTFAGFAQLLGEGGVAILHVLNYAKLLHRRERIISIDRDDDREYVRFYDFEADRVRFNILEVTWANGQCSHRLNSTIHRPYQVAELTAVLRAQGFGAIEVFGDMGFAPFDETNSPAVVLAAKI